MWDVRCSMFQGVMERIPRKILEPKENIQHPTSNIQQPMVSNWAIDGRFGVGCSMFDVPRGHGKNSPKNSRIEPLNRRKTSNIQHPTSNIQQPMVLDVRCSQGVIGSSAPPDRRF